MSGFDRIDFLDGYDLVLVVLGLGVLGLATLLHRFEDRPISFPILALGLGIVVFALPLGLPTLDPREHGTLALRLTEIAVVVSLMGVGLKLDRKPHVSSWSSTGRLLGICMPLTIAGVALLGWWLAGLPPAAALLLGASLAPTDPVLAGDVQVGEPDRERPADDGETGEDRASAHTRPEEREDELRFTLTSEAGLNDSLAFPFTYLALLMLPGAGAGWLRDWLVVDVAYRILVGAGVGVVLGLVLARILLRLPVDTERERMRAGVGALAGTLLLYGGTEAVGGYGFLAVFVGGLTIRHSERPQQSHRSLHTFAEQSEQLLMTATLLALGGAIAGGLLAALTWPAALVGMLLIFVVRPVAGLLSLVGESRLSGMDRVIASFYGIRGIGCLYYLAYGVHHGSFAEQELLWATAAFTVGLSVCVHGISAGPMMRMRDRRLDGRSEAGAT